jgi:hypothetical protein
VAEAPFFFTHFVGAAFEAPFVPQGEQAKEAPTQKLFRDHFLVMRTAVKNDI